MSKSYLKFRTNVSLVVSEQENPKIISLEGEIFYCDLFCANSESSALHGLPVPKGYHIEIAALNHRFSEKQMNDLGLKEVCQESRKKPNTYIVDPNFEPSRIKNPVDAIKRIALWMEQRLELDYPSGSISQQQKPSRSEIPA